VGALAAGVATSNDREYIDEPAYREPVSRPHPYRGYYVQPDYASGPDVVYVDRARGAEPWSRGWYRYCENRYRSFDARSGTFIGNDGEEHFCIAN
jgi:BA14K-like protein